MLDMRAPIHTPPTHHAHTPNGSGHCTCCGAVHPCARARKGPTKNTKGGTHPQGRTTRAALSGA